MWEIKVTYESYWIHSWTFQFSKLIYCLNTNTWNDILNLIPFLTSESLRSEDFEGSDDVEMIEIEELRSNFEICW